MCAVIARRDAEFNAQLNATAMLQLVGVNSQTETSFSARLQYRPRVINLESAAVAKDVDPFCVGCTVVEHFSTN